MNIESLETAIKEFNAYNGNARIYFDKVDCDFWCEVFLNDVFAAQTYNSNENVVNTYSKTEREGDLKIGIKRREYVLKFAEMFVDGWEPFQIEYNLEYV